MAYDESATSSKSGSVKTLVNQALDEKNCDDRDENHKNESKNEEFTLTKQNRKVHYRQTILSEYFSKQVLKNSSEQESKSDVNVMVNFRKLVNQLLNAKVMIERVSEATAKAKLRPKLQINLERLQVDQSKPKDKAIKYVRSYCHKCKTMHADSCTIKRMKCHKCETDLLFVCAKCNENIYVNYKHLKRHGTLCTGQKKSSGQGKSITLRHCADCDFVTAYESAMGYHVSKMNHKVRGNEIVEGL